MLDIHTHILPEMDDGSSGLQESMEMLKTEWSQGVQIVALTPHFYPDRESPERFLERRSRCAARLMAAIARDGSKLPAVLPGAEVAFFRGISWVDDIERMRIGKTNAILVEMPFCQWSGHMLDELIRLREQRGLQPIIAHVERYLRYQRHGVIDELCERGFLLQANASFFLDRLSAWTAMRMLKKQRIHLLGSDCHNMRSRKPNIGLAFEKIELKLGEDAMNYLSYMQELILEEK